jgi:hypothetical protein
MNRTNYDVKISISRDLEPSLGKMRAIFEDAGLDPQIEANYVLKSGGPIPANFIIEFAVKYGEHVTENALDWLLGIAVVSRLPKAFAQIRAFLGKRNSHFWIVRRNRDARVRYLIPSPPDDVAASSALDADYEKVDKSINSERYWIDGKWVDSRDYLASQG